MSTGKPSNPLVADFALAPGDIIYSGTLANVGPAVRGDVIRCHIDGVPDLSVKIV